MYNLLGWKAEELYNLDPKIRHGAFHVVHPEDMKLLLDKHFSVLSNPKSDEFTVELRILSKNIQEIRTKVFNSQKYMLTFNQGFVEVKRNPAGIPVLFYCVVYKHFFKPD